MTNVYLHGRISDRILAGHPWVYNNEVGKIEGDVQPGKIVSVWTAKKKFVGKGYINPQSQILVRILTRDKNEEINEAFFFGRIESAWKYRIKNGYAENCRLVFGEADYLPALIIDKFNDYFVVQTLSAGIDAWKPAIVAALENLFKPQGIYERNDVPVRELEGLPQRKGFLSHPFDTRIVINENGLRFGIDIENGQKTGYFLDQHDNRRRIRHIVRDADVLGAFCYTGSFEIHAASYGAKKVTGIDISETAIDQAKKNAEANGLANICDFKTANAFDVLKQWSREGMFFDVVMLDPPAFTKSRDTIDQAIKGYKEINLRGIKLLRKGGFLVTSSCSNLVSPELFLDIIDDAAKDARRKLRQVTFQTQAPDHPIIHGIESTNYLKFLVAELE
ncbi:MAG TPA: class I SAM-dependent rRNA methyltransferase [Puia sp.]|nr:class I SAM-dependent rRNA methyltransferase [Puia sp.]